MSKTPICDQYKYETDQGAEVVPLNAAEALEIASGSCESYQRQLEGQLEEALAEIERLSAARSVETVLAVTQEYYAAKCNHCGWVGSSEFCTVVRYSDDSDVLCPICHVRINDDEPTEKDIADFLNRAVISAFERKGKLIEQMRIELKGLVDILRILTRNSDKSPSNEFTIAMITCIGRSELLIEAALSATERGWR